MSDQRAHVVYRKLLLRNGHGYPLWIPDPDANLGAACRARGLSIGDVGLLTQDGGFDYLFNILAGAHDPINGGEVPPDFVPLRLTACHPIRKIERMHREWSAVTSARVSKKALHAEASVDTPYVGCLGGGCGFEFSTSSEEAAVLVLPHGSTRYDVLNKSAFERYAAEHAASWYEYVNDPDHLGRQAVNGSLYLVTGCDKTASWGTAAVSKPDDTRAVSLTFSTCGFGQGSVAFRSSWSTQLGAETRVFPQDGAEIDTALENQCVFIRGFTISVRENRMMQRMLGSVQFSRISGSSKDELPTFGSRIPFGYSSGSSSSSSSPASSRPGSSNKSMSRPTSARAGIPNKVEEEVEDDVHFFGMDCLDSWGQTEPSIDEPSFLGMECLDSILEEKTNDFRCEDAELLNPSAMINEFILNKFPQARVVMTHDDDWTNVVEELETEDLIQRVISIAEVRIDERGAATLHRDGTDNMCPDSSTNNTRPSEPIETNAQVPTESGVRSKLAEIPRTPINRKGEHLSNGDVGLGRPLVRRDVEGASVLAPTG
ncbi:hypothetical protein BDZ89DRAFT_1064289 [Hymenopellis radicata]|nr:hypothetical protein BDZ89DRAFT_1064289 [Hymenopellis radicata]